VNGKKDTKEIVDAFVAGLRADLQNNGVQIPTLPDISLQALFIINRDDSSIDDVTAVVARDTAMATRLVRYANSPAYRGLTRCATIKSAITRLGLQKTKNILLTMSMKEVFNTGHRSIKERMERLWEHSMEVAALSMLISLRQPHLDGEVALLAGLVHDVGVVPILNKAKDIDEIVHNDEQLGVIVASLHSAVGKAVLKAWNFDPDLIAVAAEHENLKRDPGDDAPVDYVDVVQAANIESYQATRHRLARVNRLHIPAYRRLGYTAEDPDLHWDQSKRGMEQVSRIFS
jgi:putative nucleotidyltransferase with HDIG domain